MPQHRLVCAEVGGWRIERVTRLPGHRAQVSPVYHAETPRWVFPLRGVSEVSTPGRCVLLDGLTAIAMPSRLPYQVHEGTAVLSHSHMVVSWRSSGDLSEAGGEGPPDALAWTLSPRALWNLRLYWRNVAAGRDQVALPEAARGLASRPGDGGAHHPAVLRARRFMAVRTQAGDCTGWSLPDVADAACCSYFHLARLFRQHVGIGMHAYRDHLRMALALQRLDDGESSLAALAHDLGYSHQSHLGAAFRRSIGVSPALARLVLQGGARVPGSG